jgi:glycosyltransferase involved in cell wall biosynthesis
MKSSTTVGHVFTTFLPVTSGGVEHYILNLSKFMKTLGYASLLFTSNFAYQARQLPKIEDLGYLKIFRMGFLSLPYINLRYVNPLLNLSVYKFNALMAAKFEPVPFRVDLFHIHSGYFSMDFGFKLSRRFNKPFVITVHEKLSANAPILSEKNRNIISSAKAIIIHRYSNFALLKKSNLISKIVFIPMFIDIKEYERPKNYKLNDDKTILLYVGRLEERRDPLCLIRAFSKVCSRYPNTELHIIGNGYLRKQVEALIKRYKIEKHVFLHGQLTNVKKFLWRSHIYVSTNTVDDYPSLALREAMASGLAIIDTNVGETKALIHNLENGLLIPPSDPEALSDAIITLIEDKELRKKLSFNAQLASKDFDVSRIIPQFVRLYNEAISQ